MCIRWLLTMCLFLLSIPTSCWAQAWNPPNEKEALRKALEQYTACNTTCAAQLSGIIVDQGIEQGLDLVASVPAISAAPNKLKLALFYVVLRRAVARGEKIVSSHGACSTECDKLNADAVTLGRAGALGPLIRNGNVDPQTFQDPRVLQTYLKYVKPVPADQLPWQFKNDDWWKKLSSTS
jgi:hypothetical protein